jgi:hypothetical protein
MVDWSTAASLGTAAGTLILAVATFASVRSSARSSRIAEQALSLNLRPLLHPAQYTDPGQKVRFGDGRYVKVENGLAAVERDGASIYLVIPLRNAGSGLAVLHGWRVDVTPRFDPTGANEMERPRPEDFRRQSRDLYVPAGDVGFWQGAIRLTDDSFRAAAESALDAHEPITIDLLYGDEVGGQRTITRFVLDPREQGDVYTQAVVRHWYLDAPGPRE